MDHLDGNMLAGPFAELFSFDITMAVARCARCGAVAELATSLVYVTDAGSVVRCAGCDEVLATLVQAPGRRWLGMGGISAIEIRIPDDGR